MSKLGKHQQLNQAKATFTANAKTFALAAKFLPKERYEAVARLYAFCRQLDDLADAAPAGVNHGELVRIRQEICAGKSRDPSISDMLSLQRDFEIPTTLLLDFIDTLIEDQYPRALGNVDELVQFAYGVASTVGLMMCHVFGVRDIKALPFAVDLGLAMQMTNIAETFWKTPSATESMCRPIYCLRQSPVRAWFAGTKHSAQVPIRVP